MTTLNRRGVAVVAVCGLLAAGCLVNEERHTWHLDAAGGGVTWTVFELDVRSDAKEPADRLEEESKFWNAVRAETHGTARGFRALGASSVRTRILRDEVPFSLVTEATLPAIDELGRRLIAGFGGIGTSVLERDGDARIWTLTAHEPRDGEPHPEETEGVSGLSGLLETLRVVLPRGRFESAVGFDVSSDHRVAVIDKTVFEGIDKGMDVTLRLRWVPKP
jgi:hypothetical protein